jgi:hypothetical protein
LTTSKPSRTPKGWSGGEAAGGGAAEFRLDPLVAKAALRTPDTESSNRGPDWVRFGPQALDGHAVDRAEAWLASAWRRAAT